MKLRDNLSLQKLKDNLFQLKCGENGNWDNKVITFNASAAFLWNELQGRDFTSQDVKNLLVQKYNIATDKAQQDAEHVITIWKQTSLIY